MSNLHVFIVVQCDEKGNFHFDDIYFSRGMDKARILRIETAQLSELDYSSLTFHLIKKTKKGVEHLHTLTEKQQQIYTSFFKANNKEINNNGNDCASQILTKRI